MTKKLKLATHVPEFKDNEEAAEFFETHDLSLVWDQFTPVRPFKLSPSQIRQMRERYLRRKRGASQLLSPAELAATKRIAKRKSIAYETQLRLWIAEGIRRESLRR